MRNESSKVFHSIEELQEIAKATHNRSTEVSNSISEMKDTAQVAVDASQQNHEASTNVIKMVQGFKV